jgi:uncharacterized membrane protein YdfJ with MMPL/SSD domain
MTEPQEPQQQLQQSVPSSSPSYRKIEGHDDDIFARVIKKWYFPFLVRNCRWILLSWVAIFIVTIYYGPSFLSLTKSDLDIPPDTPAGKANAAYKSANFQTSTWAPSFIILSSNSEASVVGPFSRDIDAGLLELANKHSDTISSKISYYDLISSPYTAFLAPKALSANNKTMIFTINYKTDAVLNDISAIAKELLEWAKKRKTADVFVGATGLQPLFTELTEAATSNFETIDGVVLPIAILILGWNIRSWRHMACVLLNLITAFLLAFSLLVPVANTRTINPFAPTIMLSLGIAVCFDYSLFMLSRFREEVIINKRCKEEAVMHATAAAGHVVVLSGVTLFFTFALLTAFPQNFLSSVGFGCGAIVLTSILSNMTVTPCVLLYFNCFMVFEPYPTSCCCWSAKQEVPLALPADDGEPGSGAYLVADQDARKAGVGLKQEAEGKAGDDTTREDEEAAGARSGKGAGTATGTATGTGTGAGTGTEVGVAVETTVQKRARLEALAHDGSLEHEFRAGVAQELAALPLALSKDGDEAGSQKPIITKRLFWFFIAHRVTEWPLLTLAAATLVTVPFVLAFLGMKATSDNNLVYLRGSQSVNSLKKLSANFPIGSTDPYSIVSTTNGTVLSASYFRAENALIREIVKTQTPKFISAKSVSALSYMNGNDISYSAAMAYFTPGSGLYDTAMGVNYRVVAGGLMNKAKTATLISVETIVDPNADAIVPFILSVRDVMKQQEDAPVARTVDMHTYLFGGYTTSYDLQMALYALVPLLIIATVLVVLLLVAVNFGSIFIPIRLAATVFISLSWTYGLTVMVYQPGPGQEAFKKLTPDALADSTGLYWIIPIMAFSVLVGLALDYDIFLMTRVVSQSVKHPCNSLCTLSFH